MDENGFEIGMIGLGVMGRNLVLNIADHGFSVVGYDKDPSRVKALQNEATGEKIRGEEKIDEFIGRLRKPRAVMMLVPAGAPVDSVIRDILPYLEPGDLLIDGGNSFYKDTVLRAKTLAEKNIDYLGVGISGGERGARYGPSMMPGGRREAYERVRPIFEKVAAHVNGDPCVTYLGPGAAGHYVKMVHNGLEYGLMQLIAESYDLMKRGLGMSDEEMQSIYSTWNQTELNSFLIEITANIFNAIDERTGKRLIDEILDEAKQKGTGKWTSQEALDLQVPAPTIDVAVGMRDLSVFKKIREEASRSLQGPSPVYQGDRQEFLEHLKNALYASMIIVFAQGMALLRTASNAYGYNLDLRAIASIWRGGCIIRAGVLEHIREAYRSKPELANLLLDSKLGHQDVVRSQGDLRAIVIAAAEMGIPAPGFMTSLAYFDGLRSAILPANLIQAQRDYFGAHTYERVDEKGVFHTEWAPVKG